MKKFNEMKVEIKFTIAVPDGVTSREMVERIDDLLRPEIIKLPTKINLCLSTVLTTVGMD